GPAVAELAGGRGAAELAAQFGSQAGGDPVALLRREAAQHQTVDGDGDPRSRRRFHTQPRVSVSPSGRSSLALSACAAASRWRMAIGSSASAARNAAFSAILRTPPPAT